MNPPGNLENVREFLVTSLQQFQDFTTAQPGYQPLTTFIGGLPANGPVIGPGGIPESAIFGRVPGSLISRIQKYLNGLGLVIFVDVEAVRQESEQQTKKVFFNPAIFTVTILERPDINQTPQGTGLSILFLVERIFAALTQLQVPNSVMNGTDGGYMILPEARGSRRTVTDADIETGIDRWTCYFQNDVATPVRTTP